MAKKRNDVDENTGADDEVVAAIMGGGEEVTNVKRPRRNAGSDVMEQVDQLQTPEFWGTALSIPFDRRAIAIGWAPYALTDSERGVLGHSFSVLFNALVRKYAKKSPELVAAGVAVAALGEAIVSREIGYRAWLKTQRSE